MTSIRNEGLTGFSPCFGLLFQYFTIRTSPFHIRPGRSPGSGPVATVVRDESALLTYFVIASLLVF